MTLDMFLLIIILSTLGIILFYLILFIAKEHKKSLYERRFSSYALNSKNNLEEPVFEIIYRYLWKFIKKTNSIFEKSVFLKKYSKHFEKYIKFDDRESKSGMDYISLKTITAILFGILYLVTSIIRDNFNINLLIIIMFLSFFLIDLYFLLEYKNRIKKIENDLLSAIIIMNNAFKSGMNIVQAIDIVKTELEGPIKDEFQKFNSVKLGNTVALHYKDKSQTWFLFPYVDDEYYHTIWINDYVNHAWYKRVLPQKITCAANYKSYIITADSEGKIYYEDYGTTFNGESIKFMWKSPFLSLGSFHHRKMIDEFYFVLDDLHDNNFNFSVYKDYDSGYSDNMECVVSRCFNQLIWANENSSDIPDYCWTPDDKQTPVWSIGTDVLQKAEIFGSYYSVQLCLDGNEPHNNCAIIGLQFREIYMDD